MRRRDFEQAGRLVTTKKTFSLRTLLLIFALPFIMYGLFGDVRMALVTAIGTIWLYFAVLVKEEAYKGLSAARIYIPVFFLYSGLSFLGPPMLHTEEMILMCSLSGLGFVLGWTIVLPPGRRTTFLPMISHHASARHIFKRRLVVIVGVVTVLTYGYAYSQAGVLPAFSGNPNLTRVTFLLNGYVSTIVVVGLHIMIACGFIETLILKGYRAKIVPGAICLLAIMLALAMSNRGVAVNPLVFALLFVVWQKNYKLRRLVPIGLFAVAALSVAGYVRNLSSWGETYNADLQLQGFSGAGVWFAPILNYVYGTAQTFDTTISVFPSSLPLQMGQQFFSPLLMEPSVDLYLKDVFGYDFQGFGLALGSVNAFYLDWGPLGTFIGPLIIALCLAYVYRRAISADDARWILLYCYLLMQLIFSVYGHPFAYLFYVIEPFVFFFLIRHPSAVWPSRSQPAFHYAQSSNRTA